MSSSPSYVQPPNPPLTQIQLPTTGRPEGLYSAELGQLIGPGEQLFRYEELAVEVIEEVFTGQYDRHKLARGGLKFQPISPVRFKTWTEQFVQPGVIKTDHQGQNVFMAKTMTEATARTVLESPQFLMHIPRVWRILDVPIPIRTTNGDIVMPKAGFNRDLGVYCNPKIPALKEYPLEEAKDILEKAQAGFCWKHNQAHTHFYARLLTPFGRGLIGFDQRIPCWFFIGNRPRCGKDYLNGVAQILYVGNHFEDQPISKNSDETGKRIVAALRSGRRMMHFANCQDYLQDSAFIQAITSPVLNARSLGATEARSDLELPNEIEYSLSGNALTYRDDFEPRCRKIELAYFEENPNGRIFPQPHLHFWLKENRVLILSAIYSVFRYWLKMGGPVGTTPFISYPRWAEIVGGVMKVAQLGDPCLPHEGDDLLGGDMREKAMNRLFELCYQDLPDQWIRKRDIYDLLRIYQPNDEWLEWFGDLDSRQATTRLGRALVTFDKRILDGIRLTVDATLANRAYWQYFFTKNI